MEFLPHIHPELSILIPVLYIVGYAIKSFKPSIKKNIPLILLAGGILLSCLWVIGTSEVNGDNLYNLIFTAIVQGTLCAGMAVFGYEAFVKRFKAL